MKKLEKLCIIIGICGCVWAAFILFDYHRFMSLMYGDKSDFPLVHIYTHVSLFCKGVNGGIEKAEIEKILTNSTISSLEYNRQLAEIFNKSSYSYLKKDLEENHFIAPDGLFYDAFGVPVWFMQTNNADFQKLHPDLKLIKEDFPVIVWSSGQNKSNEFGYGDDIYIEKYARQQAEKIEKYEKKHFSK